jgi:hypothetical protein
MARAFAAWYGVESLLIQLHADMPAFLNHD